MEPLHVRRPPHGQQPTAEIDGVQSQLYLDVREINDSSVTGGDPARRADPEIGRVIIERCTANLVSLIGWLRSRITPAGRRTLGETPAWRAPEWT